jgi:glycosyltransferase involved in cell wall biosynthesis
MKNDFISVVIPTYNRVTFLKDAIDSVLAQTFLDFELIVVDDGSTDDTPKLLSSYNNKARVITQTNQGPSAARNRGIEAAKSEWIAFLDSDDVWKPDKLKKQVQFITDNPDIKICQTEEVWIRNGKRVNPRKKHEMHSGWIYEKCLPLCIVSPSSVIIHQDVFEKAGLFDETMLACEDYDLWLRVTPHYPVFLVREQLIVKQGGHDDQQSRTIESLDCLRIKAMVKSLESGGLNESQYEAALLEINKKCRVYGNGCIKRGKKEEGEKYLKLPGSFVDRQKTVD